MKILLAMTAALALTGCANPEYHVFAPAAVDHDLPDPQPATRQDAQSCPASRPHHLFNFADMTGATVHREGSGLAVALVADSELNDTAEPIGISANAPAPCLRGQGKRKTMLASR